MKAKKIDAYIHYCKYCGYECEIIDNIVAPGRSLKEKGFIRCPDCGEIEYIEKERNSEKQAD